MSRPSREDIDRAIRFYEREGYQVDEFKGDDLPWDILCEALGYKIWVQVFTDHDRLRKAEDLKYPKNVYFEAVKYSPGQENDVPMNRMIFPSNWKR